MSHPVYTLHGLINGAATRRHRSEWQTLLQNMDLPSMGCKEIALALNCMTKIPSFVFQDSDQFNTLIHQHVDRATALASQMNAHSLALSANAIMKLENCIKDDEVGFFFSKKFGKISGSKNFSLLSYSTALLSGLPVERKQELIKSWIGQNRIARMSTTDLLQVLTALDRVQMVDEKQFLRHLESQFVANLANISSGFALCAIMHAFAKLEHRVSEENQNLVISVLEQFIPMLDPKSAFTALKCLSHWPAISSDMVQGIVNRLAAIEGRAGLRVLAEVKRQYPLVVFRPLELGRVEQKHAVAHSLSIIDPGREWKSLWDLLFDFSENVDIKLLSILVGVDSERVFERISPKFFCPKAFSKEERLLLLDCAARLDLIGQVDPLIAANIDAVSSYTMDELMWVAKSVWRLTGKIRREIRLENRKMESWIFEPEISTKQILVLQGQISPIHPPPPNFVSPIFDTHKGVCLRSILNSVDPVFLVKNKKMQFVWSRRNRPSFAEISALARRNEPVCVISPNRIVDESLAIEIINCINSS